MDVLITACKSRIQLTKNKKILRVLEFASKKKKQSGSLGD